MVEVWNCTAVPGAANNITSGDAPPGSGGCMYRSPTIEYLWPENVPGTPIVANNFQSAWPPSPSSHPETFGWSGPQNSFETPCVLQC
jgi:hypothetical protein